MTEGPRNIVLEISEHLFRLTTEGVRLHSNETKTYQTLGALTADCLVADSPNDDHAADIIREHLSTVPTNGDIRITLKVTKTDAANLEEVKQRFAKSLGANLTMGDALSILLFHYVAGQKAKEILNRIGFPSTMETTDTAQNVFPIR